MFRHLNPEDIPRKRFSPRYGKQCNRCHYGRLCTEAKGKTNDPIVEKWVEWELRRIDPQPSNEIQLGLGLNVKARKRGKKDYLISVPSLK